MFVYRITNLKYKDLTLSGVDVEKVGGRWNEVGTRAVYCSENVSLALLEYYVHSENIATLPKELLVAKIKIPKEFVIQELDDLPEKWNHYPFTPNTTKVFTGFVANNNNFFALKVPSTIVGVEYNYILNPLHKEFGQVEVTAFLKLPVDPRLVQNKHK
jgi:RES domain-containing protein